MTKLFPKTTDKVGYVSETDSIGYLSNGPVPGGQKFCCAVESELAENLGRSQPASLDGMPVKTGATHGHEGRKPRYVQIRVTRFDPQDGI